MLWGKIDLDGSCNIDYTEWAISTTNKEKLFTDKKVKQAFSLFDLDGSGKISLSELKQTMTPLITGKLTDEDWKQMIMTIDEDGDGAINIREFKTLMTQTFNSLAQNEIIA
jgi:Ca2+-binding EF-hand superfamily protein